MRFNRSIINHRAIAKMQQGRLNCLVGLIIFLSCVLIIRLAYLQISQFKRYETLSLQNQISVIPIAPPRGIILDRNGVVLAENIPVYVLEIIPERVKNIHKTIQKLRILLPSITDEDVKNFNRLRHQNRSFVPIPFKLNLTQEEVATFASHQHYFTGVSIKARLMRHYPLGVVTAHLLGYVSRINSEELQHVDPTNYRATNFIGKSGIEKYYEPLLHGQVGYQEVETDVSGRTLRVLNKKNPLSGEKLYLTIDSRLQQLAFDTMQDKRGAVVVVNPQNGDIITMVSTPSYDPNLFVNGISTQKYQQLTTAKDRPLFNRAVRGLYPPASTIKPFIALAGLDKGVVDTNYSVYDPGWFKLPGVNHTYRDWKKTGHGVINIQRAITVSCDTYFYQLGHRLGIASIENMLTQFGFGHLTQIDLQEEAPGLVPDNYWKRRSKGLPWYPGDTLITAIGQGFLLASPLQLAMATATLSQKGIHYRPHLLKYSIQSDNETVHRYKPLEEYPIQLKDPYFWDIVIEAMRSVITSEEGTGHRFGRKTPYTVAGKTGTAQVFSLPQNEKKRSVDIPDYLRDHSLFIAFAPVENPEVAIAVLVENDALASNIARTVLDGYFQLKASGDLS